MRKSISGFELLLDDGRRVALSGLDFPKLGSDASRLRDEASFRLSTWLAGRQAFLAAPTNGVDRWGRVVGRLYAGGDEPDSPLVGVGETLLAEGLARFRPDKSAVPCAYVFLDAERIARDRKSGLWASENYALLDAANKESLRDRKGMIVVEGVVNSIGESRGSIYLNFGPRRGVDFTVVILKRSSAVFERAGLALKKLKERRVRIRGMIDLTDGLRMEVASPAEIELVDGLAAP